MTDNYLEETCGRIPLETLPPFTTTTTTTTLRP
jgi:hypothetical protein